MAAEGSRAGPEHGKRERRASIAAPPPTMASSCENAYSTAPVDEQVSASTPGPSRSGIALAARIAPWLVLVFACALLLPGLGRAGLWSLGELPIVADVTGVHVELKPDEHIKLLGPDPLALEIKQVS